MVEKDKYLVVVSVLEGRNFPKRPRHQLIAEARFDGELLATDPVEHIDTPDFTQELAWELDKKSLQQHRLQRASIKVQCYAVDTQSTAKEAVGYVILDLRSAQSQQAGKWYPLLHSKYSKSKPGVKLNIYIDADKGAEQPSFKAAGAPVRPAPVLVSGPGLPGIDPRDLRPVLNEPDGFYQIGPHDSCSESFILSVTIGYAVNLPNLIPASVPLPANAEGYFFYYSLLGNDITNEPFQDLLTPNFQAERASVRLRSSVDVLRAFFNSQPGLEVHLCCGDQSLGSCEVPLNNLLKKDSTEIYMKPVNIEDSFKLNPPARLKEQLPPVSDDVKPAVGVVVTLRKEDQVVSQTPPKHQKLPAGSEAQADDPPAAGPPGGLKHSPPEKLEKPSRHPREPSPPPTLEGSYTDTFDTASKTDENVASLKIDQKKEAKKIKSAAPEVAQAEQKAHHPHPSASQHLVQAKALPAPAASVTRDTADEPSSSATGSHVVLPPQSHHYCMSIDLDRVKDLNIQHVANVFLRYTYPYFGSAAPIMTHPPVEARRGTEVLIQHSHCAFDFAATPQLLQDILYKVPLLVEVMDKDREKSQTTLLGVCQVPLSSVFETEVTRAVQTSGVVGSRQSLAQFLPIMSADGEGRPIGQLYVILCLEDWGPSASQNVIVSGDSTQNTNVGGTTKVAATSAEPRETEEYKAALELEMWKETQESMFESQLKEKEMRHMKTLAEEWKRRDKEREILVQKSIAEYTQAEQQLKKMVTSLEKREHQLVVGEQEVTHLRETLQREHERKLTEVREASRRMQEDCEHKVQLEKVKTKELEELIMKLKQQITEWEVKYKSLETEFRQFKEQQNSKPEVRLQTEINLLTLEKVELERKVDTLTKAKVHYKQQWAKALKELSRIRQKEQAAAKAELRRQQQELEHMRLRYLAAEEKEVVQTEKKELQELKEQLDKLQEGANKSQPHSLVVSGGSGGMRPLVAETDHNEDEHLTRLIEERDSLLRTGVYKNDDPIIVELDRQIKEAIAIRN